MGAKYLCQKLLRKHDIFQNILYNVDIKPTISQKMKAIFNFLRDYISNWLVDGNPYLRNYPFLNKNQGLEKQVFTKI